MGRLGAINIGWWRVTLLLLALGLHVRAIPKHYTGDVSLTNLQHSSNDVYPTVPMTLDEQALEVSLARNMSQTTDMREFIMKFVQDERICFSRTLRQLILGKEETDIKAKIWWSRRCGGRSGKPVNTPPVMSEMSEKEMKKLNKLIKSKKIKCNPKKAIVELPNEEWHQVKLWPSCVYIKQCSGCCDSPFLECRPTKTKDRRFTVFALAKGEAGTRRLGQPQTYRTVFVSEHKQCRCQCKVQPEHCTSSQRYDQDACLCRCPADIEKSCSPGKVWSEKDCACVCSDVSECTTGRVFDTNSCRCADPPVN